MKSYLAKVHNHGQPEKYTTILAINYQEALFSLAMLYDFFENVTCIGDIK